METKRTQLDRRTFMKTAATGGASLVLSSGIFGRSEAAEGNETVSPKKLPMRMLGKTGVSIPIIGLGGIDWTINHALLRMAYQMGITLWDAASHYENGKCEIGIGQYFNKFPEDRKNVFLVTKASDAVSPKEMTSLLDQSLERFQTDYIDLMLMHKIEDPKVLTPDVKAWSEQKKKEGKIRFFGFGAHLNVGPLMMAAAQAGWLDAILTTYNYRTMKNDDIKRGMDALAKAGVGFIAMKSQAERFSGDPVMVTTKGASQESGRTSIETEDLTAMQHFMDKGYTLQQAKLKTIWEDQRVSAVLSHITNLTILKDNLAAATDGKTLSEQDRGVLFRLAANTCNLYCRACGWCESVFPSESRVPDVLRYMMYYNSYGQRDQAKQLFRSLPETVRSALAQNDYSSAERVCPNRVNIGNAMKEAVRLLG